MLEEKKIDGLLLPGGGDVDPALYGGDPNTTMLVHRLRDDFELALFHAARGKGLPILGICRGCQLINVAMGGRVRNLRLEPVLKKQHFVLRGHPVDIAPDSELAAIFGVTRLEKVVSIHGNCVAELAPGVRVVATGPGGTPEAIEADSAGKRGWIIGIQWHPEMTNDKQIQHKVFNTFVNRARSASARRMSSDSGRIVSDVLPLDGEKLFSKRSLIARDKTRYDVEFFYHESKHRIRAVVKVGDRVLSGLFNRFYSMDPENEFSLTIRWENDSAVIYVNSVRMSLRGSTIDTDAIYDAMEAMLGEYAYFIVLPTHSGVLRRTFIARVFKSSYTQEYLVNEQGDIDPFSLKSLCTAHRREGIKAQNPQNMEGIGASIILAVSWNKNFYDKVISSVSDIPGYNTNPLDSDAERKIRKPSFHRDDAKQIDYWTCYTYNSGTRIVTGYTFGFSNGWPVSGEKIVLGSNIGAINSYSLSNNHGTDRLRHISDHDLSHLISVLRVVFIGLGLSLFLIAYLLRKHLSRVRSRVASTQ